MTQSENISWLFCGVVNGGTLGNACMLPKNTICFYGFMVITTTQDKSRQESCCRHQVDEHRDWKCFVLCWFGWECRRYDRQDQVKQQQQQHGVLDILYHLQWLRSSCYETTLVVAKELALDNKHWKRFVMLQYVLLKLAHIMSWAPDERDETRFSKSRRVSRMTLKSRYGWTTALIYFFNHSQQYRPRRGLN